MCKYGLLYLAASAIAVLRVQLRFVDCINKRKKRREEDSANFTATQARDAETRSTTRGPKAVASIARDVVVEMTPPRDDNAR